MNVNAIEARSADNHWLVCQIACSACIGSVAQCTYVAISTVAAFAMARGWPEQINWLSSP